jgi:hypothetical protein
MKSLKCCVVRTSCLISTFNEYLTFFLTAKILLTSFRRGVIPPPLCGQTLQASAPVNCIIFASFKEVNSSCIRGTGDGNNINSNALCAILSDGTVVLFSESSSTKCHVQLTTCNFNGENAAELHHWLWVTEDTFLCCRTHGIVSYMVEISFDLNAKKMNVR